MRSSFIFCSKALERVSIRNAKRLVYQSSIIDKTPQDALTKFVRNAPITLRWFRSDLTQENMNMLRLERPEIALLSESISNFVTLFVCLNKKKKYIYTIYNFM
jgi:hypothetical protein